MNQPKSGVYVYRGTLGDIEVISREDCPKGYIYAIDTDNMIHASVRIGGPWYNFLRHWWYLLKNWRRLSWGS